MVFVNSISDLFHEDVPDAFIDKVFGIMFKARAHTFQILTKRAVRMQEYCSSRWGPLNDQHWPPLPNVWLGVSAEDQETWDERVEFLGKTPAAIRFVSVEPMLGFIDCGNAFDDPPDRSPYGKIHWLICGGESGAKARPMDPDWVRNIRDQCIDSDTPFFFKQGSQANWRRFKEFASFPEDLRIREYPKVSRECR